MDHSIGLPLTGLPSIGLPSIGPANAPENGRQISVCRRISAPKAAGFRFVDLQPCERRPDFDLSTYNLANGGRFFICRWTSDRKAAVEAVLFRRIRSTGAVDRP